MSYPHFDPKSTLKPFGHHYHLTRTTLLCYSLRRTHCLDYFFVYLVTMAVKVTIIVFIMVIVSIKSAKQEPNLKVTHYMNFTCSLHMCTRPSHLVFTFANVFTVANV